MNKKKMMSEGRLSSNVIDMTQATPMDKLKLGLEIQKKQLREKRHDQKSSTSHNFFDMTYKNCK